MLHQHVWEGALNVVINELWLQVSDTFHGVRWSWSVHSADQTSNSVYSVCSYYDFIDFCINSSIWDEFNLASNTGLAHVSVSFY